MKKSNNKKTKEIEFDKLSKGLFHDLVSPITALCLGIEEMDRLINIDNKASIAKTDLLEISRINTEASHKLTKLCQIIGLLIADKHTDEKIDLIETIEDAILLMSYKAREAGVELVTGNKHGETISSDRVSLIRQIIHSIDHALALKTSRDKRVGNHLTITVSMKNKKLPRVKVFYSNKKNNS